MYDKISQDHVLNEAYRRVKAGKQEYDGGGVDGITFGMIEKNGLKQFIADIRDDLKQKQYRPQAIRRVLIPKAGSKEKRPLGIPTICDRVVQMAVQTKSGKLIQKNCKGTPQGGVISSLFAHLSLHYAMDKWLEQTHPIVKYLRYADDAMLHFISKL